MGGGEYPLTSCKQLRGQRATAAATRGDRRAPTSFAPQPEEKPSARVLGKILERGADILSHQKTLKLQPNLTKKDTDVLYSSNTIILPKKADPKGGLCVMQSAFKMKH